MFFTATGIIAGNGYDNAYWNEMRVGYLNSALAIN